MFSMNRFTLPQGALVLVLALALGFGQQNAPPVVRAYVGARLIPVTAPEIEDGVMVVTGDTSTASGERGEGTIPTGAVATGTKG